MKKLFVLLTAALFAQSVFSQTLQVPLDPERISPVSDAIEISASSIVFANYVPGANLLNFGNLNLTQFDLFNGPLWSYDYTYPSGTVGGFVSAWESENAILLSGLSDEPNQNKVLTKLDERGNVLWSKRYGGDGETDPSNSGVVRTLVLPDGDVILAGGAAFFTVDQNTNDIFVARINSEGVVIWGKSLCFSCLGNVNATLGNLILTQDGDIAIAGSATLPSALGTSTQDMLLLKISPQGTLRWARSYDLPASIFNADDQANSLVEMPNGHFVLAGSSQSFIESFSDAVILETFEDGQFFRASRINLPFSSHNVTANQVLLLDDEDVVVSLASDENTTPSTAIENNMLGRFRLGEDFEWSYSYFTEISVGFITTGDVLKQRADGGFLYMPNDAENFDFLRPNLILTDEEGKTKCESSIELRVNNASIYNSSEIALPLIDALSTEDYLPQVTAFFGYNLQLPAINLGADSAFCNLTTIELDATVPQSSATYNWTTGESSSTIVINRADSYGVEVFIPEFCLTLQDDIAVHLGNVLRFDQAEEICSGEVFEFFGEELSEAGTYTETRESGSNCDTIYFLELSVRESPIVEINYDGCQGDGYTIMVGDVLYDEENPVGEQLLANGTDCDSILLIDLNFAPSLNFSLGADTLIELGAPLTIVPKNLPFESDSLEWQTNTTTNFCTNCEVLNIVPERPGSVELRVYDDNGCPAVGQFNIGLGDLRVFIPNVFSPNLDKINDEFRVFSNDPTLIVRRFEIYNRWGTLVYQMNGTDASPDFVSWDGRSGNVLLDPAVFVYFIELESGFGQVQRFSGDVTLVR